MFSKAIFKSNLKRFWILPAVVTIIIFLLITFQMIIEIEDIKEREKRDNVLLNVENSIIYETSLENQIVVQNVTNAVNTIQASVPIVQDEEAIAIKQSNENYSRYLIRILYTPINIAIIFILPILISILLFSYSNEEKSSSFIHGLPISKKKLYITNIISGITMYIIPYLINLVILLIINLGDMGTYLQNTQLLQWFGVCILYNTVFFSFSSIIGTICASKISHGILTYILMYAPLGCIYILEQIMQKLLFGFNTIISNAEEFILKLPFVKIIQVFEEMQYYYSEQKLELAGSTIIIYIIASIIMLLLGCYIYKKRKLEITKEFIAFKFIRNVIKYCATLCVNLLAYMYFYYVFETEIVAVIVSLIVTLIAYFIIEMVLKKTYRVFKSIKGFIVYAVIIIILYIITAQGGFGFETRVPNIEDIKEVSISKYEDVLIFDEKENIETIIDLHEKIVETRKTAYTDYIIEYKLKNGLKISRRYSINEEIYEEYFEKLLKSKEYFEEKTKFLKDTKNIEEISLSVYYNNNSYKSESITIQNSQKEQFVKDVLKDIKNKKAVVNDNYGLETVILPSEADYKDIIEINVRFSLKNDTTRRVRYNVINLQDVNIGKYIK